MHRKRTDAIFSLSNMSHEMRTPLNVIIGMCDIARRHIDDQEKVEECLLKISVAGERLTQLVNNILDMSKIEQGKLKIAEDDFNIDSMMEELDTLLSPLAAEKRIVLSISSKDVVNKNVIGDYGHILQVMINLASNSIKYTPQGGFVKVWVEEIENSYRDKVSYRFICQDNGIGMSEEFQKHVFEAFSRAEDKRIQKIGGAGLGMSIVKEIMDALGGSIHIDSTLDMGTTVNITMDFKATCGKDKVVDIQEFKSQQLRQLKDRKIILVAEDMEDNRDVLTTFLEDMGFEVDVAENGEEVVDMFMESEEGYYKAILMDIEMPVMDGCQATLMIRGLNRFDSNLPIIAMTACAFEEDEDEARGSGMDDYLTKPLTMNRLEEKLKRWTTESVAQQ